MLPPELEKPFEVNTLSAAATAISHYVLAQGHSESLPEAMIEGRKLSEAQVEAFLAAVKRWKRRNQADGEEEGG